MSTELRCAPFKGLDGAAVNSGDFADAATSPNDPVFFFHHANLDRLLMTWQQARFANDEDPTSGYPTDTFCDGHALNDVVSSAMPFSDLGLAPPGADDSAPYTNTLLMRAGQRDAAPYTYDTL